MKMDITEQIRKDTDEILKTELDKFKNEYITVTEEKIEQLTNSLSNNEILIGKLERKICDLEEIVDEQINRNLRNNIIVKDIPEVEDEKWSDTKDIVATSFSNILNISKQSVHDGIERAHRGGKKSGHSPRNIYMRLYTSEDVKYYCDLLRKLNIRHKTTIKASPQFSKKVTDRRNQAMLERKHLIDKGAIKSGYVEYPATLMVKREGDRSYTIKQKY